MGGEYAFARPQMWLKVQITEEKTPKKVQQTHAERTKSHACAFFGTDTNVGSYLVEAFLSLPELNVSPGEAYPNRTIVF